MCSASKKELIEVVKYFRDEFDYLWNYHRMFADSIGVLLLSKGIEVMRAAVPKSRHHLVAKG